VVGVDVGGTFTDLVVTGAGGLTVLKVATSAGDPAASILSGLATIDPHGVLDVAHGTTVATNALLERRGARTALVATEGFADLLRLGRGERSELYALEPVGRAALVPPELCFEAAERVAADGVVLRPLRDRDARRLARAVRDAGAESVSVCLLFSYLFDAHERAIGRALDRPARGRPFVSLSVDVLPEFREYERASTVTVNAYVGPLVAGYLMRLARALAPRALSIMGSHAGVLRPVEAARLPVATVLSGPAAGVTGAVAVARRAGRTRCLTLDMGGTSTDVALCEDGVPFSGTIRVAGLPVHRPAVDIHTVGAGGGSFVRADEGGVLRVGPQSAGSQPGPVAYGRGGRSPTVTDAHIVLGRIPADRPLADGLTLDARAAREALAAVGAELGLDAENAALGAIAVANATMERALRRVSVERGQAPAGLSLVAFGGAGPLHACALAELLGIEDVLVPVAPGALSAVGLATAAPVATASRSILRPVGAPPADWRATFAELEAEALTTLGEGGARRLERLADVRYAGQSWELTVPWPDAAAGLEVAFEEAHRQRYGYGRPGVPLEVVTLRVRAEGEPMADLPLPPPLRRETPSSQRLVLDDGRQAAVPLWHRWSLAPGMVVIGPALITQSDATTFVPPEWCAAVEAWGDLALRRAGPGRRQAAPAAAAAGGTSAADWTWPPTRHMI